MSTRLTLSGYTLAANSPNGTLVGNVTNKIAGSTLTLVDDAGGRIKLVGSAIQASTVASIAGKYLINVREKITTSSQITQIEITVT
jgi:hypothetical protein